MRHILFYSAFLTIFFLSGCEKKMTRIAIGDANVSGRYVAFDVLPGWDASKAQDGFASFLKQCKLKEVKGLEALCKKAEQSGDALRFFETNFRPFVLEAEGEGLMTGYYEPLLSGSKIKSDAYPHPLYPAPDDLLHIDLAAAHPELSHRNLRGRLSGNTVSAYPSRAQINAEGLDIDPICYLASDVERFFLHVQGSGRVQLENGDTLFVGHTDRNGHPYRSIGKLMVEEGLIPKEEISLQSIRAYMKAHPEDKKRILESNPSYIFFGTRNQGATGTLGVELTPMHSIAVDRTRIPLGYPVYFAAQDPLTHEPLDLLALAQDTGSAIKGQVRADLFWGYGGKAELKAGQMKSPLALWLLVPKE